MSIKEKYENLINKIRQKCIISDKNDENVSSDIEAAFTREQENINKINGGIKIIMDNNLGKVLISMVKTHRENLKSNFKLLQEQLKFSKFFSDILLAHKFISLRLKKQLDTLLKEIKQSKQFKLNKRLNLLNHSDNTLEFRTDFFSIFGLNVPQDQKQMCEMYRKFYLDSINDLDQKLLIKLDTIISKFQNREQILGDIMNEVDCHLGQQIGQDDQIIKINQTLAELAQNQSLDSNQQHKQNLQKQYNWIKDKLSRFSGFKVFKQNKIQLRLSKFGSLISGFATKNTDMDLTILTNSYVNELYLLEQFQKFLKFQSLGGWQIKMIKNARIPLIKLTKQQLNKPKIQIDLIVNNILGVVNSKFLSVYASVPWIKRLGLLIKQWAKSKTRELVKEQLFSSYSLNLMLIHFLVQTQRAKYIMDARERNQNSPHFVYKRVVKKTSEQFPVYYLFKTSQQDVTDLHKKRVNLYQMLIAFFEYYSNEGKHWKLPEVQRCITVDGLKGEPDPNYLFTIRDPFDEKHNPGRVGIINKDAVIREFDIAVSILKTKKHRDIENMFK